MLEIRGYRIKGASIVRLEAVLREARQAVAAASQAEWRRMLAEEVTDIVDDAAMGLAPRPETAIIAEAEKRLRERVGRSGMGFDTEYNLRATAAVMTDGKDTYIILYAKNDEIAEAFASSSKSGALEDFSLRRVGSQLSGMGAAETPGSKKWNELRETYGDSVSQTALTADLTAQGQFDAGELEFAPPAERAADRARHDYTNRMLSHYATGQEIQPRRLMPLMDRALAATVTGDGEEEMGRLAARLACILPEITMELVTADPRRQERRGDGLPSICGTLPDDGGGQP